MLSCKEVILRISFRWSHLQFFLAYFFFCMQGGQWIRVGEIGVPFSNGIIQLPTVRFVTSMSEKDRKGICIKAPLAKSPLKGEVRGGSGYEDTSRYYLIFFRDDMIEILSRARSLVDQEATLRSGRWTIVSTL